MSNNVVIRSECPPSLQDFRNEEFADSKYEFLIENDGDILVFLNLVFCLSTDNISFAQFKEKIEKSQFVCEINDIEVYSLPLKLLTEMYGEKLNNEIVINLHTSELREILLYKLSKRPIVCRIINNDELINLVSNYILIFKFIKIDEGIKKRDCILNKMIKLPIEYVNTEPYSFLQSSSKKDIMVHVKSRGLIKGFILYADIYYLTDIKLYIDGNIYLDYNIFDVNNLCRLITNRTLFLSLNSTSTNENGVTRFIRHMDFSNFETCEIRLTFTNPQDRFSIYSVQEGLIGYKSERISIELNSKNINSSLLFV